MGSRSRSSAPPIYAGLAVLRAGDAAIASANRWSDKRYRGMGYLFAIINVFSISQADPEHDIRGQDKLNIL
jgi:hypothetical protein